MIFGAILAGGTGTRLNLSDMPKDLQAYWMLNYNNLFGE